jgi:NCAIR mutase (PurE)-related protein
MDEIKIILKKLLDKEISLNEAEKLLKANSVEDVGNLARLDIFRKTRIGIPEVIYAKRKSVDVLIEIIKSFVKNNHFAVISRFNNEQKESVLKSFEKNDDLKIEINDLGKIMIIKERAYSFSKRRGIVGIITAGSSDIPIAEEAKVILELMGCKVLTSYDVGIAGVHRIFDPLSEMIKEGVHIIIVCAGMEGTLPGVVAALTDVPVIGVPVSSGYGLGGKGIGALTTMLQSCSPGLLIVNIDNGFGAGACAALIANKIAK